MFLRFFQLGSRNFSMFHTKTLEKPHKNMDYKACIETLNNLQSNAQYIKVKTAPGNHHNGHQLVQVKEYLNRVGLSLDQLDELSVIHIAGTKGKGTTCALSERILREHGYTTGFYSSPHLLEVRERIRINGKPIPKTEFAEYFSRLYSALNQAKTHDHDMPLYFRFLTILAFFVFLEKKVDVAIIEVGIGGEYDCTNVLRKVPVVGITSLGIDHVTLLGETLEEIAWNKAGIMKEGCRAFTVPQPEGALTVLKERSIEKKCQLEVVDALHLKIPQNATCPPNILNLNASLAVALCRAWISIKHNNNSPQVLSKVITEKALSSCSWPGRFQVIHQKMISYYLDGAHTLESITICANWFKNSTKSSTKKKALIFNVTGNRDAEKLLKQLHYCNFDVVLFVTNYSTPAEIKGNSDNTYFKSMDELLEKCQMHKKIWTTLKDKDATLCEIFPTVLESLQFLENQDQFDLLVTGSIHLIGSVLSIVDPQLNGFS